MSVKAASLFAFLGGGLWLLDEPKPVVYVNEGSSFMSTWPSEAIAGSGLPPECNFWNQSVVFSSEMCSLFVVNRAAAAYQAASKRAMRCTAAFGSECVLSPEIGLAMPAAFLHDYASSTMRMLIAPKLLPLEAEQVHVRVAPPGGDGLTDTKTLHFNRTVRVEYLEGATRQLRKETLSDDAAYCVQLLRLSFEPQCWEKLD